MTGRRSYASGAQFATWASLSGVVTDEAGAVIDAVMGFVPTSELTIEDTWHTTGMRGTGSNTWVGEDVFVPDHRLISMSAVTDGTRPVATAEPIYRIPFMPVATVLLLGPSEPTRRLSIWSSRRRPARECTTRLCRTERIRGRAGPARRGRDETSHRTSACLRDCRDANTAARHAGLNAVVGYEVYGKALLNVDKRITAMI